MALQVGRIPFLVCAPFFYGFLEKESEYVDVNFVDGPPSAHCLGLKEGRIHLSPASSITFAQKPGAFVLSPSICTSCSFEVRSVKLFSPYAIEDLDHRRVRLTTQSQTSVTLLRILLEERFGLKPDYVLGTSTDSTEDACLLIGDLALEENERHRYAYEYDLGTLWQGWQGLPFVFGAWIVSKEATRGALRPTLEKYMEATERSIEDFRAQKNVAVDRWLERYPVQLPKSVIEHYYDVLDYRFTEDRKRSLEIFFKYAAKIGLVETIPNLEFL